MIKLFTKHPHAAGETYFQHLRSALKFSWILLGLSIGALIHSIFPFLFEFTVSEGVNKLNQIMSKRAFIAKGAKK